MAGAVTWGALQTALPPQRDSRLGPRPWSSSLSITWAFAFSLPSALIL